MPVIGGSRSAPATPATKLVVKPSPRTFVGEVKPRKIRGISINRVTGEIADVVARYKDRPGLIRKATEERTYFGRVSTGILSVDLCLAGGLMKSRGSMFYGNKSTGKTTLSYLIVAEAQRQSPDDVAAIIDIEGTFDEVWASRMGVDLDRLLVVEPESGEEAVDLADGIFRSNEICAVVTDSIAMLVPMKEIEESAEKSLPGVHARLVGNYLRRLNNAMLVERHRGHFPVALHLNQFRMKVGVTFGDPRTLPGGMALEFSTSQQIETYNKEHREGEGKSAAAGHNDGEVIYNEHAIKITKDKTGGRIKEGVFKLIRNEKTGYPVGFVEQGKSILTRGATTGLVTGQYQVGNYGRFRKVDDFNRFLSENPIVARQIVSEIVDHYRDKWGLTG